MPTGATLDISTLVQMGATRLGGVAREELYLRAGIDRTRPESIHCEVNERCNYKCRYCHFWQMKDYAKEMSIEQWQNVLLDLKRFVGSVNVKFIGGEPFIKKGFIDLVEFCGANSIRWGVITNGSALSPRVIARIVNAGPENIDISVDSPVEKINDYVRGSPGSLGHLEEAIACLRAARDAVGLHFPIRIKPTISRQTFRQLPMFAAWVAKHGATTIDFHPVRTLPFWTKEMHEELWPTAADADQMRGVIEELLGQKAAGAPIENDPTSLRSYPDQFMGRRVETSIVGACRAGMRNLTIKANGDMTTCWDFPPIGNVLADSVSSIWYGPEGKANRAQTSTCSKVGKECANSCLDHRSITQDVKRGLLMLRSSRQRDSDS